MDVSKARGSALVFTLVTVMILMGMVLALTGIGAKESEVVLATRQLEGARLVAEAGSSLVVEVYQHEAGPPPAEWYQSPQLFGNGTFQIVSDVPFGGWLQRRLVTVEGIHGEGEWRIETLMGRQIKALFDMAIQANADIHMTNHARVDSYDSRLAPYDLSTAGQNGDVQGNSEVFLSQNSDIFGDLGVVETITLDVNSSVSGDQTEGDYPIPLDPVDDLVAQMVADLSAANDNAALDPTMIVMVDGEPSVQLLEPETKVISSGDYYLNGINIGMNANLLFDTSSGPIRIVVHTDDVQLGRNSNFVVTGPDPVYIYLSGFNKFNMENLSNVTNPGLRSDLFQVVINSNDPGFPRFEMGMNTEYYGTVWAPNADILLGQHAEVFGGLIGREVSLNNYAKVHYDEALADGQWVPIRGAFKVYGRRRVL